MKNGLFRQKLFPEKIISENKVLEIKIFYNFFIFSVKIFKQNV